VLTPRSATTGPAAIPSIAATATAATTTAPAIVVVLVRAGTAFPAWCVLRGTGLRRRARFAGSAVYGATAIRCGLAVRIRIR
jgi:hypothetical protein